MVQTLRFTRHLRITVDDCYFWAFCCSMAISNLRKLKKLFVRKKSTIYYIGHNPNDSTVPLSMNNWTPLQLAPAKMIHIMRKIKYGKNYNDRSSFIITCGFYLIKTTSLCKSQQTKVKKLWDSKNPDFLNLSKKKSLNEFESMITIKITLNVESSN